MSTPGSICAPAADFPPGDVPMGAFRLNGSMFGLSFEIRGTSITAVNLPRPIAERVTGILHVSNVGDVSFGGGMGGNALEGIMLQFTCGAPAGARIRYRVRVGTSSSRGDEGFTTAFCSGGEFCGTRGQGRPLQSLCIDIVWP
jgi:hypothetical protein